ncbi:hypothetical protein HOU26_gp56 [Escherichia phage IMM-002]|uniref:Uncharacterized protein n=1 Tax=Escherichia phage IMM-002 TaxID=2041760 RepID=A0A384X1G0_9CAUD|nr:hypothetical protein HOU26_gp56 [Escherichia phage IMM-002]ATI17015.1 hypothetical protein [Escherichia phage IMM-002]
MPPPEVRETLRLRLPTRLPFFEPSAVTSVSTSVTVSFGTSTGAAATCWSAALGTEAAEGPRPTVFNAPPTTFLNALLMDLPTVNLLGCNDVYWPIVLDTGPPVQTPSSALSVNNVSDSLKNLAGGLRVTTDSENGKVKTGSLSVPRR